MGSPPLSVLRSSGLVVGHEFLQFLLIMESLFIFPSSLKESFAGQVDLDWQSFPSELGIPHSWPSVILGSELRIQK